MRSALLRMVVVVLLGTAVVTSCALLGKKETVVTIAQVPPAARAAIEKVAAGGTIKSIEKIEWNGKVTYEVEYLKEGKDLDAFFTEDGAQVKGAQR